jgi:hypothetical protein
MYDDEIRRQLMQYSRQFRSVAAPPASQIRQRLRRRRIKLTAMAGAAAGMIAVGTVAALAATLPASRPGNPAHPAQKSRLGWQPAGPELAANAPPEAVPFVVTVGVGRVRQHATVHNWRTGATLGQISAPGGRCFEQITGASDDRTFLLTVQSCSLPRAQAWFYELRLSASGRPEPLIPIGLPKSLKFDDTLALSPDGTHLAFTTLSGGHRPNKSTVIVYDLTTGAKRTWSGAGWAADPAWAGDHRLLFTLGWNSSAPAPPSMGAQLLDTAAPGSRLAGSRHLRAYDNGYETPLPAAANVMYAPLNPTGNGTLATEITRYSEHTGSREFTFKPSPLIGHTYTWCDPVWTDGSGRHTLAVCGSPDHGLRIDGDRMRRVNLHFHLADSQPALNPYSFAF